MRLLEYKVVANVQSIDKAMANVDGDDKVMANLDGDDKVMVNVESDGYGGESCLANFKANQGG